MLYGDPYWDYAVVNYFNYYNIVETIRVSNVMPSFNLTWMSGWPLIHVLAVVINRICYIDSLKIAIFLPMLFMSLNYIICLLFFELIMKHQTNHNYNILLAVIIFIMSPEMFFWSIQFKYQTMAILLNIFLFYLLVKYVLNHKPFQIRLIFLLCLIALIIAHHITSFVFIVYLTLICLLFIAGREKLSYVFALLGFVFLFVWWNNVGTIIWPTIGNLIHRLAELVKGLRELEGTSGYIPFYPSILTPLWGVMLLRIRDIFMYLPSVVGFVLIIKLYPKGKIKKFYVFSSMVFAFLFILNVVIVRIEPFRIVTYALPFIAIASSFTFAFLMNKYKYFAIVNAILIFIFVSASLLGFGAHNYISLHFFDPGINYEVIGEHNKNYLSLKNFIDSKSPEANANYITSDDFPVLYLLFKPDQYDKFRLIKYKNNINNIGNNTLIVSLREMNIYSYSGSAAFALYEKNLSTQDSFNRLQSEVKNKMVNVNKIYDDGYTELHI